jgi:hypothetical protein
MQSMKFVLLIINSLLALDKWLQVSSAITAGIYPLEAAVDSDVFGAMYFIKTVEYTEATSMTKIKN